VWDDNCTPAPTLAAMLARKGNETRTAYDGVEALGVAATGPMSSCSTGNAELMGTIPRVGTSGRNVLLIVVTAGGEKRRSAAHRRRASISTSLVPVRSAVVEQWLAMSHRWTQRRF
jgi:hypothetical protein